MGIAIARALIPTHSCAAPRFYLRRSGLDKFAHAICVSVAAVSGVWGEPGWRWALQAQRPDSAMRWNTHWRSTIQKELPSLARRSKPGRSAANAARDSSRENPRSMAADPESRRRPEPLRTVTVPFVAKPVGEFAKPRPVRRADRSSRATWARWANWVVGISAGGFLLISLGGYLYHRGQLADIAAEHLRLMVSGPAVIHVGVPQRYVVRTTTVTGHPVRGQVEFALVGPDGQQVMAHKETADDQGAVEIAVAAEPKWPRQLRMEVIGSYSARSESADAQLSVETPGHSTVLSLDPSLYHPGETVRYRSLTLSRFQLAADRELPVHFEIRAPDGTLAANSVREGLTTRGAGWGEWPIPKDCAEGRYALVASSPTHDFAQVRREFTVTAERPRRMKLDFEFLRQRYGPGEKVIADGSCRDLDGKPLAKARIKAVATMGGKTVHQSFGETSPEGLFRVAWLLPDRLEQRVGDLTVSVEDAGLHEVLVRPLPLDTGGIRITFRPEGGELVGGMENRLYFSAADAAGKPVRFSGRIVDSQGHGVALAETTHEGMGSVQFEPQAAESYRLKIDSPQDAQEETKLPPVSGNHAVVLTMGLGVLAAGDPLEFNIRATAADLPLVAAVSCRGVEVGQQTLVTSLGVNAVSIPLDDRAVGALRLAVYEYHSHPPRLLAHRLIYRRPRGPLGVQATGAERRFRPGERVELPLRVTDEQGNPLPADLAIAVCDSSRWPANAGPPITATSQFLLFDELESPLALGDLDFYLSGDAKAPAALDLLLGCHARGDGAKAEAVSGDDRAQPKPLAGASTEETGAQSDVRPPFVFDNLSQLLGRYQASLVSYRMNRTRVLNALTTLSFFGGVGLVVFVAMLSLLSIPCGLRLWGPSLGVAAACIVIGAVLMNPERLKPRQGGDVPFASSSTAVEKRLHATGEVVEPTEKSGLTAFAPLAYDHPDSSKGPPAADGVPAVLGWRPNVRTNAQGQSSAHLALPAKPVSYRLVVDAWDGAGRIGSLNAAVLSEMPFRLEPRVPAEARVGDRVHIPVGAVNISNQPLSLEVAMETGPSVRAEGTPRRNRQLAPQQGADESFAIDVSRPADDCALTVRGRSGELASAETRRLRLRPSGYPVEQAYAGRLDRREEVRIRLPETLLDKSLDVRLSLFPSLEAEIHAAMAAVGEQPGGCLEHVVGLAGSGAMLLRELAAADTAAPSLIRQAQQSLSTAQAGLLTYAAAGGGYNEFGAGPGSPTLTALAAWQAQNVGQFMPIRGSIKVGAAKWLLDGRDSAGNFVKDAAPVSPWAQGSRETENAFILWTLTESGQTGLEAELKRAVESADKTEDPLRLALVAKAALNGGRKADARNLLERLAKLQKTDGRLAGSSIKADGEAAPAAVETTALAAWAWRELPEYVPQADRATTWLLQQRNASGGFGSATATLLSLYALAADGRRLHAATRSGRCVVQRMEKAGQSGTPSYVPIAERTIAAGERATVTIDGLQEKLAPGENQLAIQLAGTDPMPYVLAIRYRTPKPPNDPMCPLRLSTRLPGPKARVGQIVPLSIQFVNATGRTLPTAVAVVGLPAGMEIRADQLDRLRQSGAVDGYHLRPSELVCYWRSIAPQKTITLQVNLTASFAGRFTGAASQAYLRDAPGQIQWAEPLAVEIE